MTMDERIADGEWFDAVVARMLAENPALGHGTAIRVTSEVALLPRWRDLAPQIAAHRAAIRLAGQTAVEEETRESPKAERPSQTG